MGTGAKARTSVTAEQCRKVVPRWWVITRRDDDIDYEELVYKKRDAVICAQQIIDRVRDDRMEGIDEMLIYDSVKDRIVWRKVLD